MDVDHFSLCKNFGNIDEYCTLLLAMANIYKCSCFCISFFKKNPEKFKVDFRIFIGKFSLI